VKTFPQVNGQSGRIWTEKHESGMTRQISQSRTRTGYEEEKTTMFDKVKGRLRDHRK